MARTYRDGGVKSSGKPQQATAIQPATAQRELHFFIVPLPLLPALIRRRHIRFAMPARTHRRAAAC